MEKTGGIRGEEIQRKAGRVRDIEGTEDGDGEMKLFTTTTTTVMGSS